MELHGAHRIVRYCNHNATQDLVGVATREGFTVHVIDPLRMTAQRSIPGGTILVELLEKTNFVAFVSAQQPSRVQLWDDIKLEVVIEIDLQAEEIIKAVRLRRDIIVTAMADRIRIFSFSSSPRSLFRFDTTSAAKPLIAVSGGSACVVAFSGRSPGHLQVVHLKKNNLGEIETSVPKIVIISAHTRSISCIALNIDGSIVATASETGTLVRLWRTDDGKQLCELRRGLDKASIQSISFSPSLPMPRLAVVSDKGTVHIYNVSPDTSSAQPKNKASSFATFAAFGIGSNYFGSSWSVAQAKLRSMTPATSVQLSYLIAWLSDIVFVVFDSEGIVTKFQLSMNSTGDVKCEKEGFRKWFPKLID